MRRASYFSLMLPLLFGLPLAAQRLSLEDQAQPVEKVNLLGSVVEVRKYSFIVATPDGEQTVKLGKGVSLELRLHKPQYQPESNKLLVMLPGTENSPARTEIELPLNLFLRVQFAHEHQMKRIMSSNPKRLNNYQLSPEPFPLVSEKPVITGKLIVEQGRSGFLLLTPDAARHEIILGHQNASMRGFDIQDLKPLTTRIKIDGFKSGDAIVANRASFWPVEAK